MQWTSALAIYFLFWFLCLFLVLPFYGRRDDGQVGDPLAEGHDRGAPAQFPVWHVVARVTVVAALTFGVYFAVYTSGLITRETLNWLPAPPDR